MPNTLEYLGYIEDGSNLPLLGGRTSPLPNSKYLQEARQALTDLLADASSEPHCYLPTMGRGMQKSLELITCQILPALPNQSSQYYGFVTGSTTPAAKAADYLVTSVDANVQVHLPAESIATEVEEYAMRMLMNLLDIDVNQFPGKTMTTGATASNIIGLLCAREYLINTSTGNNSTSKFSEYGMFGIKSIRGMEVLVCKAHSSMYKAASVAGIGRANVISLGQKACPWAFDFEKLEARLKFNSENKIASIVTADIGEVNTGQYTQRLDLIRQLCDTYGAWMHVDGAFGIYVRTLRSHSQPKFRQIAAQADFLELADSITGDNHKTLNVPYDSGFFLTRHSGLLSQVFANTGAAYLSSPSTQGGLGAFEPQDSPLNVGIENSRRFRSLPVFATLVAYGLSGYQDFVERIILSSQSLAKWIHESTEYELLTPSVEQTYTVVLFRAKDGELNKILKHIVNRSNKVYVSGTVWEGRDAIRVSPCSWETTPSSISTVQTVLEDVIHTWTGNNIV